MRIRTLLFASYRDISGSDAVELDLHDNATVSDLLAALRAQGGVWANLPASAAVAVNHRYAQHDLQLSESDEVALIPPVAGG